MNLDDRTKEQKAYDESWRRAGMFQERKDIVAFLSDWLSGDIHPRATIEEIVDIIERGGHHE